MLGLGDDKSSSFLRRQRVSMVLYFWASPERAPYVSSVLVSLWSLQSRARTTYQIVDVPKHFLGGND